MGNVDKNKDILFYKDVLQAAREYNKPVEDILENLPPLEQEAFQRGKIAAYKELETARKKTFQKAAAQRKTSVTWEERAYETVCKLEIREGSLEKAFEILPPKYQRAYYKVLEQKFGKEKAKEIRKEQFKWIKEKIQKDIEAHEQKEKKLKKADISVGIARGVTSFVTFGASESAIQARECLEKGDYKGAVLHSGEVIALSATAAITNAPLMCVKLVAGGGKLIVAGTKGVAGAGKGVYSAIRTMGVKGAVLKGGQYLKDSVIKIAGCVKNIPGAMPRLANGLKNVSANALESLKIGGKQLYKGVTTSLKHLPTKGGAVQGLGTIGAVDLAGRSAYRAGKSYYHVAKSETKEEREKYLKEALLDTGFTALGFWGLKDISNLAAFQSRIINGKDALISGRSLGKISKSQRLERIEKISLPKGSQTLKFVEEGLPQSYIDEAGAIEQRLIDTDKILCKLREQMACGEGTLKLASLPQGKTYPWIPREALFTSKAAEASELAVLPERISQASSQIKILERYSRYLNYKLRQLSHPSSTAADVMQKEKIASQLIIGYVPHKVRTQMVGNLAAGTELWKLEAMQKAGATIQFLDKGDDLLRAGFILPPGKENFKSHVAYDPDKKRVVMVNRGDIKRGAEQVGKFTEDIALKVHQAIGKLKQKILRLDSYMYVLKNPQSLQGADVSQVPALVEDSVIEIKGLLKDIPANASRSLVAQASQKTEEASGFLVKGDFSVAPQEVALRQMGINPVAEPGPLGLGSSLLPQVLGKDMTVPVKAVNIPEGKVLWFNFNLAKKIGIDVPEGMVMTPEFEKKILAALSYRILKEGEDLAGRQVIEVRADRYGGSGIGTNQGAGRAAFLPYGNLCIKGAGQTPLLKDKSDFHHAHGGAPAREGVIEAVLGTVNSNLFNEGSTEILASIDIGENTEWGNSKEARALMIRAGSQQRIAHFLPYYAGLSTTPIDKDVFERFVKMTELSGLIRYKKMDSGEIVMDAKATIGKLIDNHARTFAEAWRWRIFHGASTASNTSFEGGLIDLGTETSQPRTAPITVIGRERFGQEHWAIKNNLYEMLKKVERSLSREELSMLGWQPLDEKAFSVKFGQSFFKHIQLQMLKATGMKRELVEKLQVKNPKLVQDYYLLLAKMMALEGKKVGPIEAHSTGRYDADKKIIEDVSALDVYGALGKIPSHYFSNNGMLDSQFVRKSLDLLPSTGGAQLKEAEKYIEEFCGLYPQVIEEAVSMGLPGYENKEQFIRSIITRAEFENEPLDLLYRVKLRDEVNSLVDDTRGGGDLKAFQRRMDEYVSHSLRNVDKLLRSGESRLLKNGAMEIEKRNIEGIDYSFMAYPDGKREISVTVPIKVNDDGTYELFSLANSPRVTSQQLKSLKFRYTTDGWESYSESGVEIKDKTIQFNLPSYKGQIGILSGLFHCEEGDLWLKAWGEKSYEGYVFASPDKEEFKNLEEEISRH